MVHYLVSLSDMMDTEKPTQPDLKRYTPFKLGVPTIKFLMGIALIGITLTLLYKIFF